MSISFSDKKLAYQTVTLHIVGCIAFLFLPLIASPRSSFFDRFNFGPPEIQGVISSFLFILFFYLNYFVFIPKLLHNKKRLEWLFVILLFFAFILFAPRILTGEGYYRQPPKEKPHTEEFKPDFRGGKFSRDFPKPPHNEHENIIWNFFRRYQLQENILKFLFVLAFSFLLKTTKLWKESKEERRKAELLFLKSQVNPHFLFNTLNGIYALSIEKSIETPQAIIKLSELMRYVVTELEKEEVLLTDEIKYLKNYIDLQQLRFGDTVKIDFEISEINPEAKISPLLFINFVENAFKYGIDPSEISVISLCLNIIHKDLYFSVRNKHNHSNTDSKQLRKGLKNVIRRLELIYPQRHELKITNTELDYFVELTLKDIIC